MKLGRIMLSIVVAEGEHFRRAITQKSNLFLIKVYICIDAFSEINQFFFFLLLHLKNCSYNLIIAHHFHLFLMITLTITTKIFISINEIRRKKKTKKKPLDNFYYV